ncbi:MAG: hypothetical protein CFE26_11705 [Verrucomicrobiales bacterium VVV1]|nr:MAG: hypothetical protein CFE26_11705 [Verrucomicrobiales bacterium VVV1]
MKSFHPRRHTGFTLIELTLATFVGLAVATMVLTLVNQQFAFLRIYGAQSFLAEEAPIINNHISNLVGQATRYRLHNNVTDALAGTNVVMTNAPVILLNFQQPDGTQRATILAFQNLGTGMALYYYVVPVSGALGTPQWVVTRKPTNVRFAIESGVLRVRLTGPAGEEITYSGNMQR